MIQLDDSLLFAEGGRRRCFIHPDDPNKCVKILSANGDPRKRRREAVWYKKLRPLSKFDDNLRELKSFQDLSKKGEAVWSHFPRCYGIHPTSLGDGIVTDLIRDADGQVSLTVRQYVNANGTTTELLNALGRFFGLFRDRLIITRDFLDHNLVVQDGRSELRVYMIDGFGSAEFIPYSQWVYSLGRRKIERKIARFKIRYELG